MDDLLDNRWIRIAFAATGFGIVGLAAALLVTIVLGGGNVAGTAGAAVCVSFTLLFGAALCGYGLWGVFSDDGGERAGEDRILKVARMHDGRVTVAQVAQGADIPMRDAQAMLEDLAREGLVRMEIADNGVEQYVFSGLGEEGATELPEQSYEATLREARERVGQIGENPSESDAGAAREPLSVREDS